MVPLLPALSVVVLSALLPQGPHAALTRERDATANVLHHVASAAHDRAPLPLREDDLPWCVSADDPRCAPLHNDAGRLGSDTSLAFAASQPHANSEPPLARFETRTPRSGLAPRLGVSHRVERPPRGGSHSAA